MMIGRQRFPLVYFSRGLLAIDDSCIDYESDCEPDDVRQNLNLFLRFSIGRADEPVFGRHKQAIKGLSYYSINWIEIVTSKESFLLCVGGSGPTMGSIEQETDVLFQALVSWRNQIELTGEEGRS
jgi:hypothetical protein